VTDAFDAHAEHRHEPTEHRDDTDEGTHALTPEPGGWAAVVAGFPALTGAGAPVADASGALVRLPGAETVRLRRRDPSRVRGEVYVLGELHARGVPAPVPLTTASGAAWVTLGDAAYLAYRDLPGRDGDPWTGPGAVLNARRVGRAAALLGDALRLLDPARARAEGIGQRAAGAAPAPYGCQIIHRDLHGGNILFPDDAVATDASGFLDFDHLEIAPRLVDICYAGGTALARTGVGPGWLAIWDELVGAWARTQEHAGAPLLLEEAAATGAVLREIEEDFARWFRSVGDAENAALTDRMLEFLAEVDAQVAAIAGRYAHRRGEVSGDA